MVLICHGLTISFTHSPTAHTIAQSSASCIHRQLHDEINVVHHTLIHPTRLLRGVCDKQTFPKHQNRSPVSQHLSFNISTHFTTLHMMEQLISQLVINNEQKIWNFMHFLNFVFRQPKSVCPIRIWENKPRKSLLHNTFFLVHSHDKRTDCNCHSPHKGNSKTAAFSPQSDPISDVSTHHTKYHIR